MSAAPDPPVDPFRSARQEAFDRVWRTFIVDNAPLAFRQTGCGVRCVYNGGADGKRCAIGILVPPVEAAYLEGYFSGKQIDYVHEHGVRDELPGTFALVDRIGLGFAMRLQEAHDETVNGEVGRADATATAEGGDMDERLRQVAREFDLQAPDREEESCGNGGGA